MRKTLLPVLAIALLTGVAACDSGSSTSATGQPATSPARADSSPADRNQDDEPVVTPDPGDAPEATPSQHTEPTPVAARPLTCDQLANAELGNAEHPYNGHHTPIRLVDGGWSGDGMVVRVQWPCAIGDLTGDDVADAVVPVLMDGGGTGKFWQLVFFGNVDSRPHYVSTTDIGDRTPVEEVSIRDRRVTVVYLTRPEDPSSTVDVVRRTATYQLRGGRLVQTGYTDTPR